jgi:ribosome-binding protein aMBF1 (putative translation factor)
MPLIALDTSIIAATALTIVLLASALCGVLACVVMFYQAQASELPWASEPALVSTPDEASEVAVRQTTATPATPANSGMPTPSVERAALDMRPLDSALARCLRANRHEQRLTYLDLFTRTGLSMKVIASVEHGLIAPTNAELELLAEALGTTSAALEAAARE